MVVPVLWCRFIETAQRYYATFSQWCAPISLVSSYGMKSKWLFIGLVVLCWPAQANPGGSVEKEMVAVHNMYRSRVGTPPLAWSESLAARAQQWATALIQRGLFTPRRDSSFGENLFEISGGTADAASVVRAWMSEGANYHYATNTCTGRCGHFTQVVWRSTKLVGCGVARNAEREVWVCDYAPHGNVVGERPY